MTEHFGFFDAIQDSNGHYDREYNAQQWNEPFRALVTSGVMKGAYNQLEVTANGANMVSSVKSGIAFIEGRFYYNDALVDLTHDTEVMGLSRIDRIVVRMDSRTEARHVKTFIKKGVPSTNPVVPTLTQTPTVYEISLAQVRVVGGQTYIASNAITDERGKDIICPWAGSNILPSFDDNALAEHIVAKASSTQEGHVRLNNTLTSSSSTEAATANVVKQLNDKLEGQWVTITPSASFEDIGYPPRVKKVGGLVVVEAFLKVANALTGNTILTLPIGYRSRHDFPFRITRQRGSVYEYLNGVVEASSIMMEGDEMSKYAVGDFVRFHIVFATN
ncbi:MAG: phage tail protein [Solibacillus sp.]